MSKAYVGKNKHPLYAAAMNLIVKANREIYEEERDMCQAIRDLFADEFAEKERQIAQLEDEKQQATLQGIAALTEVYKELGWSKQAICGKISEKFQLSQEQIGSYVEHIWCEV